MYSNYKIPFGKYIIKDSSKRATNSIDDDFSYFFGSHCKQAIYNIWRIKFGVTSRGQRIVNRNVDHLKNMTK